MGNSDPVYFPTEILGQNLGFGLFCLQEGDVMRQFSATGYGALTLALYASLVASAGAASSVKVQTVHDTYAQTKIVPPPGPEVVKPEETPTKADFEVSPPLAEKTVVVEVGKARRLKLNTPFKAVYVTDTGIVDVIARTDQAVTLLPKKEGDTNIYFVGQNDEVVLSLDIDVSKYVEINEGVRSAAVADPAISPYRLVEVHNKAKLDSITNFRCGPNGCFYIGETTVEEPAALPVGHTAANNNVNYQSGAPPASNAPPAGK